MLAELYQEAGRLEEATRLIQQLAEEEPESLPLKLSLCDLLTEDGDHEGVIEAAVGIVNDSDQALACLLLKAKALSNLTMETAAISVLGNCLRKSKRDAELLKAARYDRAVLYAATGKVKQARKDRERLYSDDPKYRDVAELLKS